MEWLFNGISDLFSFAGDFLMGFANALINIFSITERFYGVLNEFRDYLHDMTLAAQTGNINGLPLHGAIATYRYLVGDLIFYFTYLLVMIGTMFVIYKIGCLIYKVYSSWKSQLTFGGTSAAGLGGLMSKIFKM